MKQEKDKEKNAAFAPGTAADDDYSDVLPPPPIPPPFLDAAQVHQLCTHGYVGVALPRHLAAGYADLLAAADAFFAQPIDAKTPYGPGAACGAPCSPTNTERGYTHLAGEKEFLTLRRSLSFLPPGPVAGAAAPVWHDTAHLLLRILGDVGRHVGVDPQILWDLVHDSLVPGALQKQQIQKESATDHRDHPRHDPPTLLRLFRYAPGGGGAEPHRDLGMLTLCVCWGRGLKVRPSRPPVWRPNSDDNDEGDSIAGAWHPQDPAPWEDAPRITVMAGDTLHLFAHGRVPSAVHRVVVSEDVDDRRSIVFALRATTEGQIDAQLLGGAAGETIGARLLFDTIRQRRVNVNTGKGVREAMRSRFRAQSESGSSSSGRGQVATDRGTGSEDGPIGVA